MKISDDMVTLTELVKTYRNIEKVLREHFFSIENTNKHLVTIDIEKTDNCENNAIEFKIISEVGVYNTEKSTNMSNTDNPFGPTDWWSFGFGDGKCHGYSGGAGWDAARKISQAVITKLLPHSYMYYFTNTYKVPTPIYPNDISSIPQGIGHYLYGEYGGNPCVSPQNMNYYYNRLLEVVDYYKPAGKTFQTVALKGDIIVGIGKSGDCFHYIDKLWYGIKHKREIAPVNPCW